MPTFYRLRRMAALLLVPLVAGTQPLSAAERTQTANVVTVASLAAPQGVLSGTLGSWQRSVPAANGNPVFVIQATASATGDTDSVAATEWSVPAVLSENGAPGVTLGGTALVNLYQRSASAPAAPSGTFTYTFATKGLSGGTLNGWSQTIPAANGIALWVIVASVSNASGTGTIAASSFGAAVQLAQDSDPNLKTATVRLYQRAASAPAVPGEALTYTFSSAVKEVPKTVRGDLLLASDGNIYFASTGGGKGFGGIGRVAPDGALSVVHAFADDGSEGLSSYGGLIQASDGNLYGTTFFGGDDDDSVGTVFKLTLAGEYTRLHDFVIDGNNNKDPRKPYTGLAQGPDGNLYGTTLEGGDNQRGTIYRISTTGTFSVIHHFKGGSNDGSTPEGQLIVGSDGKLYGTTMLGGGSDRGVIYRISTDGTYEQLYSFPALRNFNALGLATNSTGANPRAGLTLTQDGFYGTTYQGGAGGNGTLYHMTLDSDGSASVTAVYSFKGGPFDAGFPLSTVTQGPDGSFYGTSLHGGYGYNFGLGEAGYTDSGTVWRVAHDGSSSELLHSFFGSFADGSQPYAGVLFVNGTPYAIGSSDDTSSSGMLIRLMRDTGSGLPVELSISNREIEAGESITITWNAPGAVTCNKSGAWDEPSSETDPEHITPITGSKNILPGIGIYTYMLSCTDVDDVVHHAFVGVNVNPPVLETVDGGEIVGGGTLSWLLLALFATLLIRKLIKETRSSCP